MNRSWLRLMVLCLSVIAGGLMIWAFLTYLTSSPSPDAFLILVIEKGLDSLGKWFSAPVDAMLCLTCVFLIGFLPVFIIGRVFIALAGRSRQDKARAEEGSA